MLTTNQLDEIKVQGRTVALATTGEPKLGPLALLPGTWQNLPNLPGRGWNMIALPFAGGPSNFRLLANQFNEQLVFSVIDVGVPNRGIERNGAVIQIDDQFTVALDYDQFITQVAVEDFPASGLAAANGSVIHREPGLWLNMGAPTAETQAPDGLDLARLGTIPHGDSILALGKSVPPKSGGPTIPDISGLPIGVDEDLNNPYLAPYKHFHENFFKGLFDPVTPNALLKAANQGVNIVSTTELHVDTALSSGGIVSIPFITRQANATQMNATFWIQELADKDNLGNPILRLQYTQTVMLEFFDRKDGKPGLIKWPHVSINTLEKVISP